MPVSFPTQSKQRASLETSQKQALKSAKGNALMKHLIDLFLQEASPNQLPELVQQLTKAALETPTSSDPEAIDRDPVYGSLSGSVEIALTFDDGPKPTTTKPILDELKKRNIRATFFVLGEKAERPVGKDLIRRMLDEGHTVGNHSWSHENFRRVSIETVRDEVERTQELLTKLGVTSNYIRAPYGATNKAVRSLFHELGLDHILWNVDPEDWRNRSIEWVQLALNGVARHEDSIIVMHDIKKTTAKFLPLLLDELQEKYTERNITFVNEF